MDKKKAVRTMFGDFLHQIPQEWVKIVAEHYGEYPALPMWGTMWFIDDFAVRNLETRVLASSVDDIEDDEIREKCKKLKAEQDYTLSEQYVDEEMAGNRCVLDKDGDCTSMYLYEIGDETLLGVNAAGFDFFDGVWDKLYDAIGLKWHDEEDKPETK